MRPNAWKFDQNQLNSSKISLFKNTMVSLKENSAHFEQIRSKQYCFEKVLEILKNTKSVLKQYCFENILKNSENS